MSNPCPVCQGTGAVPSSFYGQPGDGPVTCRTCGGRTAVDVVEGQVVPATSASVSRYDLDGL